MTAFFPAFAVFLMWRLQFIDNIYLRTQKERIVPFIITMIFYWWMWYLSRNFTDQPSTLQYFYFGIFLTTIAGLIINNFVKISMHAMGIAGAFAFVLIHCFITETFLGPDIATVTLLTGLVCTVRLLLDTHSTGEVYAGVFVGGLAQVIAMMVL